MSRLGGRAGIYLAVLLSCFGSVLRAAELSYTPVTPCRLVDTRVSAVALGPRSARNFSASDTAAITAAGGAAAGCAIPAGPTALALTITAVVPPQAGNLVAYPAGTPLPLASSLNFLPGQVIANTTIASISPGAGDNFSIYNNSDGATHITVDVVGYFWNYVSADCQKTTQGQPLAAGSEIDVASSCAAGYQPAGGGCATDTPGAISWLARGLSGDGNGYHCLALNSSASAVTIAADTLCCRTPGIRRINQAPVVSAGADASVALPANASLSGSASDDGLPNPPGHLTLNWSKVSGPGGVTFGNGAAAATTAAFTQAGIYVLRLTGNDGALATSGDVTITVNAALLAQTITFNALSDRVLGAAPFAVSASASSGLTITFSSPTAPVCTVSGSTVTLVAVGTCTIVASQAGNTQYAAAQASQSFSVTAAVRLPQTITGFAPASPVDYSLGASFTLSATGGASGNPVLFASTTPAVCTVAGSSVNLLAPGTCSLTANQAGNATYASAPQVSVDVIVRAVGAQLPTLVTPALPHAATAQAYTARLIVGSTSALGPVTVLGLPAGLAATDNGVGYITIVGTPTSPGVFPLSVAASNGAGSATLPLSLTVDNFATNVTAISSSESHTCVVLNGGVRCWGGQNRFGELGPNSVTYYFPATPLVAIPEGSSATAVSAGQNHTCVVIGGGVQCWGFNGNGTLGNGTTVDSKTPVVAIPAGSGATAVAAGAVHTCAVVSGGLKCWGYVTSGQAGDTNLSVRPNPITVIPANSGVSAVATGEFHTCFIMNGGVRCWGINGRGQVGNNSVTDTWVPPYVVAAGQGATDLTAGSYHSCAVVAGTLQCWGSNALGQQAGTSIQPVLVPTTIATPGVVTAVAAGGRDYTDSNAHTCAVVNGGVLCWGDNGYGQLGDGHTLPLALGSMVQAVPNGSGVTQVATGAEHACAVVNGGVSCWGDNFIGELGAPTPSFDFVPAVAVPTGGHANNVGTSAGASCVALDGGVKCWGRGTRVIAAPPGYADGVVPLPIVSPGSGVAGVVIGAYDNIGPEPSLCVVQNGGVACFGIETTPRVERFAAGRSIQVIGVSTYGNFCTDVPCVIQIDACAVVDGGLQCWNQNTAAAPVVLIAASSGVTSVSMSPGPSLSHACAVVAGGLMCWGANNYGQFGIASPVSSFTPVWSIPAGSGVTAVSSGQDHTCAIISGGVKCWGYNAQGQLGNNSVVSTAVPFSVIPAGSGATAVAAGAYHTCAVIASGVQCWGYNLTGLLGNGTAVQSLVPVVAIPAGSNVSALVSSGQGTCAAVNGGVVCWGDNTNGATGNPRTFGAIDLSGSRYSPVGLGVHTIFAALQPSVVASAPTISAPVAGPGSVSFQLAPPSSDGGSRILTYTATCSAAGHPTVSVTVNAPATSMTVTGLDGGVTYTCSAVANNGAGAGPPSATVTVTPTVNPVTTVALTAPVNGATFVAPASITLAATANPSSGTSITQVEFFQNAASIGVVTSPPYTLAWNAIVAGAYQLSARATDSANVTATSAPVAITVSLAGETITYLHNDFAGSPIAATDSAGAVIWKESYQPFGSEIRKEAPSGGNRQFFTGKPYDADTGLSYFGARYYDPLLGRFMGVDPAGFGENNVNSFNRFGYANNNPYRFFDPDGRDPEEAIPEVQEINALHQRIAAPARDVAAAMAQVPPVATAIAQEVMIGKGIGIAGHAVVGVMRAARAAPIHHICTNKNCISPASGGPWTPRFEAIFEKAGMKLEDALNKVAIPGHRGPHPETYHQTVFDRLVSATSGRSGAAYRNALQAELNKIASELRTAGSELNRLVTKP